MNTNNPSDKIEDRDLNQDANEKANERKKSGSGNAGTTSRMQGSSQNSGPDYSSSKGTGMSSESGSSQSEKSWQGPGGSQETNPTVNYSNQSSMRANLHNQGDTGNLKKSNKQNESTKKDKDGNKNDMQK